MPAKPNTALSYLEGVFRRPKTLSLIQDNAVSEYHSLLIVVIIQNKKLLTTSIILPWAKLRVGKTGIIWMNRWK